MTRAGSGHHSAPDVIIVGAGPAGSSLALRLARSGVQVLLLDRANFPRDKPCAEYLNHDATRLLAEAGALAPLLAAGAASLAGMHIRAPNGTWIRGAFDRRNSGEAHALSVRRVVLDATLLSMARSAGAMVHERSLVSDVLRDHSGRVAGVCVRTADGASREFRAPITVAADGLRSTVARRLSLVRRGRLPRRLAFVGHFTDVLDIGDTGEMHVEPDGFMGLADSGGGETVAALVVPHASARSAAGDTSSFLRAWIARRPHLAERFSGAHLTGRVRAVGPFATRVHRAWSPGAALIGDAAGYFDPFTGEGIRNALLGAKLLAPRIVAALEATERGDLRSADASLAEYAAEYRAELRARRVLERIIAAVVAQPRLINHVAASLAARQQDANLLVAVTGAERPASDVLRAGFVGRLVLGRRGW